jgi:hypothetical protein
MKISDPHSGTYVVSRYRYHHGLGVETFDQDNEAVALYPFSVEVEVIA